MTLQRRLPSTLLCVSLLTAIACAFAVPTPVGASIADEIHAKQLQIDALQKQIDIYQSQADAVGQKSKSLQDEIAKLNAQIGQINAQIRQLNTSIDQAGLEIQETSESIADAVQKITVHQQALAQYVRITNENDQKSLSEIILQNNAFSEFYDYVYQNQLTQTNLQLTIESIRGLQEQLDDQRDTLEGKQSELQRMKALTEVQQRDLASTKGTKNTILKETKGQEAKFQQLIKKTTLDLNAIREQIYYLQQSGITVEDAVKYAQLAAIGAGIRPAFLLALLEVESRLGLNVGTGNWQDDMVQCYIRISKIATTPVRKQYYLQRAETEKNAFLKITSALGLNPDTLKVSKEPTYGCGGAMGPAQFIPSTWLAYAPAVMQITGRNVANPWNTQDAFTASAIKLARGGATTKDRAGETAAAKLYIAGSATCTKAICNSYTATILQKASVIEQNL